MAHKVLTVRATLTYLAPLEVYKTEKPYLINVPRVAISGGEQTNQVCKDYEGCLIHDMRPEIDRFLLDRQGFQVLKGFHSDLPIADFNDTNKVRDVYCHEVVAAVKELLGAETVLPLGHTVRQRDATFPRDPRGSKDTKNTQPIKGVHVDYTPAWAFRNACMALGEKEAQSLFQTRRVQILNTWRPIYGPLHDWPLALLDYTTMDPSADLVPSDNVYPHMVSETFSVLHNEKHQWYYLGGQMPDEMFLFKSFDNLHGAESAPPICAHGAFENPGCPPDEAPRRSVECIMLLIYPES